MSRIGALQVVAFVFGNVLVLRLPALPDLPMLGMLIPASLYLLSRNFSGVLASLILGSVLTKAYIVVEREYRISGDTRTELLLSGEVVDLPVESNGDVGFLFRVSEGELKGTRLRLTWFAPTAEIRSGQRWQLWVQVRPARGSLNFALFDYERWLFANRIHGVGYVLNEPAAKLLGDTLGLGGIRYTFKNKLMSAIPAGQQPTILALTMGDASLLTDSHWRILNRTGTTHLLIVSGLHVGLIAGLTMALSRLFGVSVSAAVITTLIVTATYSAMSGWGLPVQRAFLMTTVVLCSLWIRRRVSVLQQFLFALLIVTIAQPLSSLVSGYWLSFGAVFALLLVLQHRPMRAGGLIDWFGAAGLSQWVVFLSLLPVLAFIHQQMPLASVLVNFFAIPWVGLLLVPISLIGSITVLILEPIGIFLLLLAGHLSKWLWFLLECFSDIEVVLPVSRFDEWQLVLALTGSAMLLMPSGLLPKWPGLLLLCVIPFREPVNREVALRMTFLDVGQGLSVLIETNKGLVLYDTGPEIDDRFSAAERQVLPTIRKKGWDRIEYLVISHMDNDHAGGEFTVRRSMPTGTIIKPDDCNTEWQLGDVSFRVFTVNLPEASSNDSSCLLLITHESHQILLTGDIESAAEHRINESTPLSLMSVPHHGSRTSSSPSLLNRFLPTYAVISAGYLNRFNHPHPDIVRRYEHRNIGLFNTAMDGAVEFSFNAEVPTIRTARATLPAIWRQDAN